MNGVEPHLNRWEEKTLLRPQEQCQGGDLPRTMPTWNKLALDK